MDMIRYLNRIQFTGQIALNPEALRDLHLAHMFSVPFENLDIWLKRPILLNEAALWNKIVTRRRGGFCYELNGLFAWLLNQIGFEVTCLNGRVFNKRGGLGIDFDHLVLLVAIPGLSTRWLVDVGFGDSFVEPLPFEEGAVQIQGLYPYKVERADNGMALWRRNYERAWERQYFFDLEPRTFPNDYLAGCLYHQSSPQSSFTLGRVVSRATPEGRITLDDNRLIVTTNGRREELPVQNEVEFHKLLKKHFDIKL